MSLLASAGTVLAAGSSALVDASGAPTPSESSLLNSSAPSS